MSYDPTDPDTWHDVSLESLSIKELIEFGVEVRDELKNRSRLFKDFEKQAKELQLRVGMQLKEQGDKLGVDSFKTEEGTAYRNFKESYRVGDWNQVLAYIKDSGNWQMLEKRVGKLATKEIHTATGAIPPGVSYVAEEVFVLRRPNEKAGSED